MVLPNNIIIYYLCNQIIAKLLYNIILFGITKAIQNYLKKIRQKFCWNQNKNYKYWEK